MTERDEADDALMRRAGGGDKAAFAVLLQRHFARAVAVAQRIVGNRSDAEEIVQEAFLRCWQKAPEWRPANDRPDRAQFGTWLYRVLVNLCLDRRRRPQPVELEAAGEIADSGADGFEQTLRGETGKRVAAAMAALPERQRAALALCYYEDMGNIEAAAALEISVGALESLLVRARRALRDSLADLAADRTGGKGMMQLDRFRGLLDAYGARPRRWPAGERAAAEALLARSAEARALQVAAAALDVLLDQAPLPGAAEAPAARRMAAAITARPQTLVAGRRPGDRGVWVKAAGLAAAALIGFVVGWTQLAGISQPPSVTAGSPFEVAEDVSW